jgi:hypothetical protein
LPLVAFLHFSRGLLHFRLSGGRSGATYMLIARI